MANPLVIGGLALVALFALFSGDDKKATASPGGGGGGGGGKPPTSEEEIETAKVLGEQEGCADGQADGFAGDPSSPNPVPPDWYSKAAADAYTAEYLENYDACYGPAFKEFTDAKGVYTTSAKSAEEAGRVEGTRDGADDGKNGEPYNPNPPIKYTNSEYQSIYNTNYMDAYAKAYGASKSPYEEGMS